MQRASLLAALQEVKADPKDLEKLVQLQTVQTIGRGKYSSEDFELSKSEIESNHGRILSCIKGKKRSISQCLNEKPEERDANVVRLGVGFQLSLFFFFFFFFILCFQLSCNS